MTDAGSPPPPPLHPGAAGDERPRPSGPPLAAFVEGILDGRVADGARLAVAARALSSAGAGPFRVDVQGGRFSLLPVETRVQGAFDEAAQTTFLAALQDVLAAATPGSVESNLRCRLVYADDVVETLFVARGAAIEPLSRRRARTPADHAGVDGTGHAGSPPPLGLGLGLRRRELLLLAPVLFAVAAFGAWQAGWIDRVLGPRAEDLARETGPFGELVVLDVARSWGNYEVRLRRGPSYPATPQEAAARKAEAKELTHATACEYVADGRAVVVQLVGADGTVLAETKAELAPLLSAADAQVTATLPARMGARTCRLALHSAPRPR